MYKALTALILSVSFPVLAETAVSHIVVNQRWPWSEKVDVDFVLSGEASDVEVTATVINVLAGENEPLLASCDALRGYVRLVRCARSNMAGGMPFDAAVDSAVQQCIDEGLLVDYLLQRRSAVVDMFMDEYDEEKIARLFRRDGFREGREEGLREGLREGTIRAIASLVRDGLLDVAVAAERAGVTEDEIYRAIEARG
jgi:hypothetical protein